MEWTAAVITVSDKGSQGLREDTSGPALREMLEAQGYQVVYTTIIPDDFQEIQRQLKLCADEKQLCLVLTTGGTGFSPRDVTPEATETVLEKRAPGIPEAMRAESMRITPMGCLSRETAGIRGGTLIINLPGSKKAATENFSAVIGPIRHGLEVLRGVAGDCAQIHQKGEHHHHG
jgi:molybdenum cofactor synthesis domain-containing protein